MPSAAAHRLPRQHAVPMATTYNNHNPIGMATTTHHDHASAGPGGPEPRPRSGYQQVPGGPQASTLPRYQQVPVTLGKERKPLKCAPQDVMNGNGGKESGPDTHTVPQMVSYP